MQNKFFKIILLIAVISVALFALTYFTRTAIDIGCAKTGCQMIAGSGIYDSKLLVLGKDFPTPAEF